MDGIALLVGIAGAWALHRWAKKRQEQTGQPFPSILAGIGVALACPRGRLLAVRRITQLA